MDSTSGDDKSQRKSRRTRRGGPPLWVVRCIVTIFTAFVAGAAGGPVVDGPVVDLRHLVDVTVEVQRC